MNISTIGRQLCWTIQKKANVKGKPATANDIKQSAVNS